MAKILIKTITHCVGQETEDGPEVTLLPYRVLLVEEELARSCIELGGAIEANDSDLQAQEEIDKARAEFEARRQAALG